MIRMLIVIILFFLFSTCTNKLENKENEGCLSKEFWKDFDAIIPSFKEFLAYNGLSKKEDKTYVGIKNFLILVNKNEKVGFGNFKLPPHFPHSLCHKIKDNDFYSQIFTIDTVYLQSEQEMVLVKKPNLEGQYFLCMKEKMDSLPYPLNEILTLRLESDHFDAAYTIKNLITFEDKLKMDDPMLTRFLITEFFLDFVVDNCQGIHELSINR